MVSYCAMAPAGKRYVQTPEGPENEDKVKLEVKGVYTREAQMEAEIVATGKLTTDSARFPAVLPNKHEKT